MRPRSIFCKWCLAVQAIQTLDYSGVSQFFETFSSKVDCLSGLWQRIIWGFAHLQRLAQACRNLLMQKRRAEHSEHRLQLLSASGIRFFTLLQCESDLIGDIGVGSLEVLHNLADRQSFGWLSFPFVKGGQVQSSGGRVSWQSLDVYWPQLICRLTATGDFNQKEPASNFHVEMLKTKTCMHFVVMWIGLRNWSLCQELIWQASWIEHTREAPRSSEDEWELEYGRDLDSW